MDNNMNYQQPSDKNTAATVATVCGIIGLVVSILGGITFGVIGAFIGIALGVVGLVMGIKAKKETNDAKGTAGFVCGLLGIIFGALFAIGCATCGAGSFGYGCYGCIGGSCVAANDVNNGMDELYDVLEDLN